MKKINLFLILGMFLIVLSGCWLSLGRGSSILVSKDQQWTIPKGQDFRAIQKPKYKKPKIFKADEDLMVMYKGTYMEEQERWNENAWKRASMARIRGIIWGAIAIIGIALATWFAKWAIVRLSNRIKKKEKS